MSHHDDYLPCVCGHVAGSHQANTGHCRRCPCAEWEHRS